MREVRPAVLSLAAGLLLGGCFPSRFEERIVLRADGSGTALTLATMSARSVAVWHQLPPPTSRTPRAPLREPTLREMAAARDEIWGQIAPRELLAGVPDVPGIHAHSASRGRDDERGTLSYRMAYEFDSVRALAARTGAAPEEAFTRNGDGTWTFHRHWGGEGNIPAKDVSDVDIMYPEGLRWSTTVTLPGEVLETNGARGRDPREVTWTFRIGPRGVVSGRHQFVRFRGDGVDLLPTAEAAPSR